MAQLAYEALTLLALVVGAVSVAITIPKVKPHWRGAYWMGLGLAVFAVLTFLNGMAIKYFDVGVPGMATAYLLQTVLALLALELILVPYIHRKERAAEQEVESWTPSS